MATLSPSELTLCRNQMERATNGTGIPWTKPQLNAAAQAVEDILVGGALQTAISNAINTATSPLVLSATQKRQLVAYVLARKAERDK